MLAGFRRRRQVTVRVFDDSCQPGVDALQTLPLPHRSVIQVPVTVTATGRRRERLS